MPKILFVITSSSNMGDLALCEEWIADLGREDYRFAFVLHPRMEQYLEGKETLFFYEQERDARQTVLHAHHTFGSAAIIFATNAFWNLSDQSGVQFGKFLLEEGDVEVPVFSFDPFEIGFDHVMPQSGSVIPFAAVPDWVWALRYMSRQPLTSNAIHFCTRKAFEAPAAASREEILTKWIPQPKKHSLMFPISRDRFNFIRNHYPNYYQHLANIFSKLPEDEVQVLVIHPENVPEFEGLSQVCQLGLVPFRDFLDLIYACDLYLTDSFVSCMVNAYHIGTPSLLLTNSPESESMEKGTFLQDGFFPYRVFPYGMYEVCQELEELHEVKENYLKAEILDVENTLASILELVRETLLRKQLIRACKEWKEARYDLPSPRKVLEKILTQTPSPN